MKSANLPAALLIALTAAACGCKTSDSYWSMPLTRQTFFKGRLPAFTVSEEVMKSVDSPEQFLAMLALGPAFVVAFDILALPVTLAHDIWLCLARSSGKRHRGRRSKRARPAPPGEKARAPLKDPGTGPGGGSEGPKK